MKPPVHTPEALRRHYDAADVAESYVADRFNSPIGRLVHRRQVGAARALLGRRSPRRWLEVAAGPARLAAALPRALVARAVSVDASLAMLCAGKRRMDAGGGSVWRAALADALALPFATASFDLVATFRFLRHLDEEHRAVAYAQCGRVLSPGGALLFDAVNRAVSAPLRAAAAPGEYPIYDALLSATELRAELSRAGFELESLQGVGRRFALLRHLQIWLAPRSRLLAGLAIEAIDRCGGGPPLEWIVTCRRA